MNKKLIILLASMGYLQMSLADQAVGYVTGTLPIIQQPGTYDQQSLDKTKILLNNSGIDAENKSYLTALIQSASDSVSHLRSWVYDSSPNGIQQKASQGYDSEKPVYMNVNEFMMLKAKASGELSNVEQAIGVLGSLSNTESQANLTIEGKQIVVDKRLVQDIEKSKENLESVLKDIKVSLENIVFRVKGSADVVPTELTLTSQIPATMKQMSATIIGHMYEEVEKILNPFKDEVFTAQRGLINSTKSKIDAVRKTYGTSQNGQLVNFDEKGMKNALTNLQEIFVARTVARYYFGQPIGTIGVDYNKSFLNFDAVKPTYELVFANNDIYTQEQLIKFTNTNESNFQRAEKGSHDVFGKGVPFISRIMSLITKVTLRESLSKVNTYALKLLASDAKQDLMMYSAIGHDRLTNSIKNKFADNPEWKAEVSEFFKAYYSIADANQQQYGSLSFMEDFRKLSNALRKNKNAWTQYKVQRQQIKALEDSMNQAAGGEKAPSLEELGL